METREKKESLVCWRVECHHKRKSLKGRSRVRDPGPIEMSKKLCGKKKKKIFNLTYIRSSDFVFNKFSQKF